MPAIGIDLGTTNSCVAVFKNDKVEIIPNKQGHKTTPSVVAFTDSERIIGNAAKNQAGLNSLNTIYDVKRIIGRRFDDLLVQKDIKNFPFKIINENGTPKICTKYKGQVNNFTPEEISSMVLTKLKEIAENFLGESIEEAVITVPAYFNDSQRQATKDAGTIAGLHILRIINEPTAAALAYGLEKNLTGEKNVLIFDLGGGTFDVSILTIEEGSVFEVLSTAGDTHLGGEDFDNRLVDYFAKEFKKKYKLDLKENPRALRRLRNEAERLKINLSSSTKAVIEIDALHEGFDFHITITRKHFEDLCSDLFKQTLIPVQNALKDAKINKQDIQEILLVGGSTRIPKIQNLLKDYFCGKTLNLTINPDEAVAYGAAIQAAILSKDNSPAIKNIVLCDVAPLSLGIELRSGEMSKIIKRNSKIPCNLKDIYTTNHDKQTKVSIMVFEGERTMARDNNLLGSFDMCDIPIAKRGVPKIEVSFDLDANGILSVTAREMSSKTQQNIVIKNNKGRLTQPEIKRMILAAEMYRKEDEEQHKKIACRNSLEEYVYQVKNTIEEDHEKLSQLEKDKILTACKEVFDWLNADSSDTTRHEYVEKLKETVTSCEPTMIKLRLAND